MRTAATLASMILLAGCASEQTQRVALDSWSECVKAAVARMDDGKTDPTSLAYGISPMCAAQYAAFTEQMVRSNITDNGQLYARAEAQRQELRLITAAVLAHRRKP